MDDKVNRTDKEWHEQLSSLAFNVTRKGDTERPFTNDNFPKDPGTFHCVCCDSELFNTFSKYDSGTGWPSFFRPILPSAVSTKEDHSLFRIRTEVLCNKCDAHLGHVFPDGPPPTKLRYCINGIALTYKGDNQS